MAESLKEEVIKALNEIRWELSKSDGIKTADWLVVFQSAWADQILSLIIKRVKGIENPYAADRIYETGRWLDRRALRATRESRDEAIQAVIKEVSDD